MLQSDREAADLHAHAHHAIQVTFLLEGAFEVGTAGASLAGPIVAIASDAPHTFRAHGAVAFLFIDPESAAGRALAGQLFADRAAVPFVSAEALAALDALKQCLRAGASEAELLRLGRAIVPALATAASPALPDPRVVRMMAFAVRNLEDKVTLPSAAAHINLSEGRARHLFAAHTGLPFKTYVLWLRIERAVQLYAGGHSLTEAAHQAGFADSAHFSRTFRRTFGLPAAALRFEN
ncbi:MAG: helix-turn-helix transcriptional regulator [Pseudomonadota bacterium]